MNYKKKYLQNIISSNFYARLLKEIVTKNIVFKQINILIYCRYSEDPTPGDHPECVSSENETKACIERPCGCDIEDVFYQQGQEINRTDCIVW